MCASLFHHGERFFSWPFVNWTRKENEFLQFLQFHHEGCVKRGEKDINRSKGTRCTQYSDKILLIFRINIVEDTDHKHSRAINHQLPEKTCLGTEEQGGAAQSVNLVKEHAHDTCLPWADAIFREKQNVTVCFACCKLGAHTIMTKCCMCFKTWMSV